MRINDMNAEIVRNGFGKEKYAEVLGMTYPTLMAKQKNETFTIKDIKVMRETLSLTDEQILSIFFD